MLYWLIIIKLFSCRKGPFCGRLWLLVLHSVYGRMRHPGLRRPYFDVPDASIRTLYEAWHSFLHIKDHATGRANWLESIGHLFHFRSVWSRIIWVSHPLFVCYCTNVRIYLIRWQVRMLRMSGIEQGCRTSCCHVSISNLPKDQVSIFGLDMTLMCMTWHEVIEC